jgi:hypothetical protein
LSDPKDAREEDHDRSAGFAIAARLHTDVGTELRNIVLEDVVGNLSICRRRNLASVATMLPSRLATSIELNVPTKTNDRVTRYRGDLRHLVALIVRIFTLIGSLICIIIIRMQHWIPSFMAHMSKGIGQ